MEAVAVLGAGAYLASALFGQPPKSKPVNPTSQEEFEQHLAVQEVMQMRDMMEGGNIAPKTTATTTRLPWLKGSAAPVYVHRPGLSHLDSPMETLFTQYLNAAYHNRIDTQQQLQAARQQYARNSAQPIYQGFTDEMKQRDSVTGRMRSTQVMNFSFLPRDPTDSDWNDAALLAKQIPRDPNLFTPESNFATAPGLPFRYAPY